MTKSELKAFIKEEILSILSEDEQTQQDIEDTKELTQAIDDLAAAKKEAGLAEEEEAPAGDKTIEKKASKQDKIVKQYNENEKELQSYLQSYKTAKNEEEKKEAFDKMKKLSQSEEYKKTKEAYEKLKRV
jgi:hypothetical protein